MEYIPPKYQQEQHIEKREMINDKIQTNISLKPYNTFNIQVTTKHFVSIENTNQLKDIINNNLYKEMPKLILGGGSNLLFVNNFQGLILKIDIKGIEKIKETKNYIYIKAGAGENWHTLVEYCLDNNYAGIENLSLIPGTVGAAPIQNIGAYGIELKEVFHSLDSIEIESGGNKSFTKNECKFGYRDSIFKNKLKNKYIITYVTLKLRKKPKLNLKYGAILETLSKMGIETPTIKNVSNAVIKIRTEKLPDPSQLPNAGSFFKNPEISKDDFEKLKNKFHDIPAYKMKQNIMKIPAAWLIEKSGWKGKKIKNVGTHNKQPLVIINYGEATGQDINNFAKQIQLAVKAKFGIYLEEEVNIIK